MRRQIFLTILTLLTLTSFGQLFQKFDSLFNSYYANGLFEGTALIADDTGITYHKSFGFANHDYKVANKSATVFRVGSLEKQFTAMLIMQLIEKGKLRLKGKLSDYLPQYRKETGNKITIEHLLTHTSGIPNYTAFPNVWNDSLKLSYPPEYILKQFCSRNLEFEPGTKFKYSNSGYFILAQIIEKVTGKHLSSVLKENILIPAGMNNTGLEDNILPVQDKALGYFRLASTYINEPYIYVPNTIGAASLYSTAYDIYLWDRVLYTDKLLSKENLKSYTSPHFKVEFDYAYGLGWEFTRLGLAKNDTLETMEHSGAIRAFRAVIFRIPAEKKCIILFSNCANQSSYDLFLNIMQIFRSRTWNKPNKLIADILYPIMKEGTVENVIQFYKKLKITDSTIYNFNSSSLELLGERLLLLQKYAEAAAIFRLAVKEYPNYTYGYFYLGRTYEKWGKPDDAISAYEKVVIQDKNSRAGIDAAYQIEYLKHRNK